MAERPVHVERHRPTRSVLWVALNAARHGGEHGGERPEGGNPTATRLLVVASHAWSVANQHFGKLADVWKHLVLAEVLAACRPERFYDTNAGHAVYPMITDPERRFGVLDFIELARGDASLASSEYFCLLDRHMQSSAQLAEYPAGPMIAMLELGEASEYCFCDLDPDSTANLREVAAGLGLEWRVRVVEDDGMTTVNDALVELSDPSRAVVYLDPFDQFARRHGLSAVDLCQKAAEMGTPTIHWYGYDRADERHWLFDELCGLSPDIGWWCGDIMVTSADSDMSAGDLGDATSPGTGFGLVCANVPERAITRSEQLGTALARQYDRRTLPNGRVGGLSFARMAQPR